jgi:uncharacterized protein
LKTHRYLFDAGVLSLYYAGDPRVRNYFQEVFTKRSEGYSSEVNLAEFYYKTGEKLGLETAENWYLQIRRSAIDIISPNEDTTRKAARLKIKHRRKLSLADCFALAATNQLDASIITTDSRIKTAAEAPTIYIEIASGKIA